MNVDSEKSTNCIKLIKVLPDPYGSLPRHIKKEFQQEESCKIVNFAFRFLSVVEIHKWKNN